MGSEDEIQEPKKRVDPVDELIQKVHNARMGHFGVRRTWKLLNKHVPGHGLPVERIREFVANCIWCQKLRMDMADSLPAPVRAINPQHARCGVVNLTFFPM